MDIVGIIGAVVGVGALAVSWYTAKRSVRKDKVEALVVIIEALQTENARLSAKLDDYEKARDDLSKENVSLRRRVTTLEGKYEDALIEINMLKADNEQLREREQMRQQREQMRQQRDKDTD